MSDTNLNIAIGATDAGAQAALKALSVTTRELQAALQALTSLQANASSANAASIGRETSAIKTKIAALNEEAAAIRATMGTSAAAAQAEASYINKNMDLSARAMQQRIRMANQGAIAARQAAEDSARYEAEAINRSMTLREQATRQAIAQNNARVNAEREAEERNSRAEAEYTNRDRTLAAGQTRGAAGYENRDRDLAANKARAEAQYINHGMDAASAKARAEAEYANRDIDLIQAKTRAEAEYINAGMQAEAAKARAEADYANRNIELIRAQERAEADYINRDIDLQAKAAAKRTRETASPSMSGSTMIRHAVSGVDELARGQRGAFFSTLGATARDAGLGVMGLTTSMVGLVAIMGAGAFLRGAESIGKWAAESRAAASAAGMSLEAYSQLQGALVLTGMKANEADSALRRIAVNLSAAIADPASKAAEAFHVLGISQDDLIKTGGDTEAAIKLLADAFVRTADGGNKSAAMSEIAGRGFASLILVLQNGSTGLNAFEADAKKLGRTLDEETAAKLEKAGQAVEHLGHTITGGATQAFAAWSPIIIGTAEALETLWGAMSKVISGIGTVVGFISTVANYVPNKALDLAGWATGHRDTTSGAGRSGVHTGEKVDVPAMAKPGGQETVMDSIRNQVALAGASVSKGGNRHTEEMAEINTLQQLMATEVLTDKQRETLSTELANRVKQANNEMATAGAKAAKQSYADFASAEKLKITEAQGSASKITAIYDEWISAANSKYKEHVSVVTALEREKVQAINTARLSEIKEGAQSEEQQNRLNLLNSQLATYQGGSSGRPTKTSGPQADMADAAKAIDEAKQIEASASKLISSYEQIAQTAVAGSETQKAAQSEIMSVLLASKEQEVALYQKAAQASQEAAKKIAQPFIDLADNVGSQLQGGVKTLFTDLLFPQIDLLKQGLTTIKVSQQGNELRALFQKVFMGVASDLGNTLETALGHSIAQALSGGASNTIGELLGNLFSRAMGSVTGNAIGGAATSVASKLGGDAASEISRPIVDSVEKSGSNVVTNLLESGLTNAGTIVGSIEATGAANVIATDVGHPSFLGFSAAGGAVIPSFAGGGMSSGGGGIDGKGGALSVLHPREMVLPSHISEGMQNMFANGGRGNTSNSANINYAPTINTGSRGRSGTGLSRSEFSQMLSLNSGAMLGQARSMISSGWRPA